FFLLLPASPGLANGWPLFLVGIGIAALLTGLIAMPREKRLIFPGITLVVAGIIGTVVSLGLLDDTFTGTAASFWPVALAAVAVVWLLPVLFRQRR
ncbi:MAG: hypothetical protein K8I30_19975, partial [Anaerolineae bacterium]|nr:hypothetical protein [Anaerolineae bacterium]